MSSAARAPQPASQAAATPTVRLGLRANWPQFTLLVVVNAFVGGMVGLERTTISLVGTRNPPAARRGARNIRGQLTRA